MSDTRAILRSVLLCAVVAGTPASFAFADGAASPSAAEAAGAPLVGFTTGGQNAFT